MISSRGLTLVELMVTLVILTVGLTMVLRALTYGLRSGERLQAAGQAQYDAEAVRLLEIAGVGGAPS